MRGKIKNGQVIIGNGKVGKVGREGRDFPFFKLNLETPEILINSKKTLPTLPTLPPQPINKAILPTPCLNLDEWRRINIPAWQRILKESQAAGDKRREEYARYILIEVLKEEEESRLRED